MYNKKYVLANIEEFHRYNLLYEDIKGCTCYLAYFNPGERGWFLYEEKYGSAFPHRVHTTVIEDVQYLEDKVIVTSQNTRFTFEVYENVR